MHVSRCWERLSIKVSDWPAATEVLFFPSLMLAQSKEEHFALYNVALSEWLCLRVCWLLNSVVGLGRG